jgi:hypothetical protein
MRRGTGRRQPRDVRQVDAVPLVPSLGDIETGLLVNVISSIGQRMAKSVPTRLHREQADALNFARWFREYRVSEDMRVPPDLDPATGRLATAILGGHQAEALLRELLAARLADAPDPVITRVRESWELTFARAGLTDRKVVIGLFGRYDKEFKRLNESLTDGRTSEVADIRERAQTSMMLALLNTIDRHRMALATGADPRTEDDFLISYRRHVREEHGYIQPPDSEQRQRIPLADIYVPTVISPLGGPRERHIPIEGGLALLTASHDRMVLLGEPGGGKTTAANVLMDHYAADPDSPVPFLVTLREFAATSPPSRSVVGHIEHQLDTLYQCPAEPGLVDRLLVTGRALVIFDGLDELLDTSRRAAVSRRVEHFGIEYPHARMLVTSRIVGYEQARLDDTQFASYILGGFGEEQVRDYVRRWFALQLRTPAEAARKAATFIAESAEASDIRRNPLMLSLMCLLYHAEGRLPRSTADVYGKCAELLFFQWDEYRGIKKDLRAAPYARKVLRHLAWWLFTRGQARTSVTEHELVSEAAAFLIGRAFDSEEAAEDAAREFVLFCRDRKWVFTDVGTNAAGRRLYAFTHRTFLEYFTAEYLAYRSDTPAQLAEELAVHLVNEDWAVVGELATQIKNSTSNDGADTIYVSLLSQRLDRNLEGNGVLPFLARSLRSVIPPPAPAIVHELTRVILGLTQADRDDYQYPLSVLLQSCRHCAETVNSAIGAWADDLVSSNDVEVRAAALRLVLSLPYAMYHDLTPNPTNGDLMPFWLARRDEYAHAYAAAVTAVARTDVEVRLAALGSSVITLEQVLAMSGGLQPLLAPQQLGSQLKIEPFLLTAVKKAVFGYAGGQPNVNSSDARIRRPVTGAVSDLTAIGRHLFTRGGPPWAIGEVSPWPPLKADDKLSVAFLSPEAYLGAAAVVLIFAEANQAGGVFNVVPANFGALRDLQPYVARRWGGYDVGGYPDLPIPLQFRQVFRDWADGKIDFIAHGSY